MFSIQILFDYFCISQYALSFSVLFLLKFIFQDFRLTPARSQPINSNIARALTSFSKNRPSGSQNTTPTHSQPSSPMRKESSPFSFTSESKSAFRKIKRESVCNQKINKLISERSQVCIYNDYQEKASLIYICYIICYYYIYKFKELL